MDEWRDPTTEEGRTYWLQRQQGERATEQLMVLERIAAALERIAAVLEENNTESGFLVDTPNGAIKRSVETWGGADN